MRYSEVNIEEQFWDKPTEITTHWIINIHLHLQEKQTNKQVCSPDNSK